VLLYYQRLKTVHPLHKGFYSRPCQGPKLPSPQCEGLGTMTLFQLVRFLGWPPLQDLNICHSIMMFYLKGWCSCSKCWMVTVLRWSHSKSCCFEWGYQSFNSYHNGQQTVKFQWCIATKGAGCSPLCMSDHVSLQGYIHPNLQTGSFPSAASSHQLFVGLKDTYLVCHLQLAELGSSYVAVQCTQKTWISGVWSSLRQPAGTKKKKTWFPIKFEKRY
jgi:hypothetical protein